MIVIAVAFSGPAHAADPRFFRATPIKAPECVTDTTGYFFAEDENNPDPATALPALSHYYFVVRNLGLGAVAASPNNDFGRFPADYEDPSLRDELLTGLSVPEPRSKWQRSTRTDSTVDDSSAFQMRCIDAGSYINTWTFPFTKVPGSGAHSVYGFDFHDAPPPPVFDSDPTTDFVIEVGLEVPWVALWADPRTGEVPVGQVSLFAYFRDRTAGKLFVVLLLLFDNRLGVDGSEPTYIADDLRTPFVGMTLNAHAEYATLSPASSSATGVAWRRMRLFRGHISQDNFRRVLHDLNMYCATHGAAPFCEPVAFRSTPFSEDVASYDVTQFGLLHEVGRTPDSNISMAIHFSGLGIWNFHRGTSE
jgi:hypothetical protein